MEIFQFTLYDIKHEEFVDGTGSYKHIYCRVHKYNSRTPDTSFSLPTSIVFSLFIVISRKYPSGKELYIASCIWSCQLPQSFRASLILSSSILVKITFTV